MKFTFSWLKEYLKSDVNLATILENLTDLGLEVEKVDDPIKSLEMFTVGKIIDVLKHQNAERLSICSVQTNLGLKQIICGAKNVKKNLMVVVAHPGDFVPGIQKKINIGSIRGVKSYGMLCSEKEMMVSDNHEGIIELPTEAKVGEKYIDYIEKPEITIEIAITPNRPDALSVKGIARDLASRGLGQFVDDPVKKINGNFKSPIGVKISKEILGNECSLFIGRYIKGVVNKSSPNWLKGKLEAIGIKPISALVDITNYITFDRGRPLHVFDADMLDNNILIQKAKNNQKITALDNKEYIFRGNETIITSKEKPISIAGIIGGLDTSVDFETKNIFLESAVFSTLSIAQTGRQFQINSDARYRFERGIDPKFTEPGIELATKLILDICGGSPSNLVKEGLEFKNEKIISFNHKRVDSLVGINIPKETQYSILTSLGFELKSREKLLVDVCIPSWRPDIDGEADLVEEIVRVFSLSKLKGKPLVNKVYGVKKSIISKEKKRISILRRVLAASGFNECVNYSFIDKKLANIFLGNKKRVEILNPISSEMNTLRPSLIPGLCLSALKNISRGQNDIKFFEIGEVFFGPNPKEQNTSVTGIMTGKFLKKNVHTDHRNVDVFDIKSVVEFCLRTCGLQIENLIIERDNLPEYLHPHRSAKFVLGSKKVLSTFGELHPIIQNDLNFKDKIIIFEMFLENIPFSSKKKISRPPLIKSDFQFVERDFSFVFPKDFEVQQIEKIIKSLKIKNIVDINIFDIFEDLQNEIDYSKQKKSITFSIKLLPFEKTFTDDEIEEICKKIIYKITELSGGTLRV